MDFEVILFNIGIKANPENKHSLLYIEESMIQKCKTSTVPKDKIIDSIKKSCKKLNDNGFMYDSTRIINKIRK